MKKVIWLNICFIIIIGCTHTLNKNSDEDLRISTGTKLSPFIDSLLKEYSRQVPDKYGYAIFLDKRAEDMTDYMITMAPILTKVTNLDSIGVVNYLKMSNRSPIIIFSGLEDFVTCSNAKSQLNLKLFIRSSIDFKYGWSYVHTRDTSYIVKGNNNAFSDITLKPTIYFHPPIE